MIIYNRSNISFKKATVILSFCDVIRLLCGGTINVEGRYEIRLWGK